MQEQHSSYILKDKCASCGNSIKLDWGNYVKRGNFCEKCNAKAGLNSIRRIKRIVLENKINFYE